MDTVKLVARVKALRDEKTPYNQISAKLFDEGFRTHDGRPIDGGQLGGLLLSTYPEYRVRRHDKRLHSNAQSFSTKKSVRERAVEVLMQSKELTTKEKLELSLELMTRPDRKQGGG